MSVFRLAVASQCGRVVGLKATTVRTFVTLFTSVPVGMDFEAGFVHSRKVTAGETTYVSIG